MACPRVEEQEGRKLWGARLRVEVKTGGKVLGSRLQGTPGPCPSPCLRGDVGQAVSWVWLGARRENMGRSLWSGNSARAGGLQGQALL